MQPTETENEFLYALATLIALLFIVLLLAGLVSFLNKFCQELIYLNSEIRRTFGSERKHWKRRRRRLWLSLLPFVKY